MRWLFNHVDCLQSMANNYCIVYTGFKNSSGSNIVLLWAINGFLIVLGQPLIKWITGKLLLRKSYISWKYNFLISFVIVLIADKFSMFAIAMVILTVGENASVACRSFLSKRIQPHRDERDFIKEWLTV